MSKLVYLSGGMTDLSYEDAMAWRVDTKEKIEQLTNNWKCFNPMEHFDPHCVVLENIYGEQLDKYAMDVDLYKLRQADVMILNLNHPRSIGTNIEVGIAIERRIPIIGFADKTQSVHSWHKQACSVIVDDYDDAIYEFIEHFINID